MDEPLALAVAGQNDVALSYHIRALTEAGLIESYCVPDTDPGEPSHYEAMRLRWAGHEFLAAVRDDMIWKKVTQQGAKVAGGLTLDLVKALAVALIGKQLGLGPG